MEGGFDFCRRANSSKDFFWEALRQLPRKRLHCSPVVARHNQAAQFGNFAREFSLPKSSGNDFCDEVGGNVNEETIVLTEKIVDGKGLIK